MTPSPIEPDDRLNDILLAYVEACEAGSEPSRTRLFEDHPDLREDIEAFFAGRDEIERLAGPVRDRVRSRTAERAEPELGRLGDFRLLREVGRGGMGVVYEAEQISLREVALKALPFASALDARQLQRFKNEAAAAANLRHENIVPVHAVGNERGVHYYAMQFIEGQSLAAFIAELRDPNAAPSLGSESTAPTARLSTLRTLNLSERFDWIAGLGIQSALALEHAHQMGVVHRDIKPANLLLDPTGQVWVTDFGLAMIAGDSGLTVTGELLGTLRYASPEQALGRRGVVDHRSDVYSLGATLFELMTLQPPFNGRGRNELLQQIADDLPPKPRTINPTVPAALETIVLKALRKEPSDRYSTAQEFADDLRRFLDRRPVLARPAGLSERFRTWARRHPSAMLAAAVTLILLTAGSVLIAVLVGAEQERTRAEQQRAEEALRNEQARAAEAEARFRFARRSVDEMFRISQEELADRPGLEGLRKRLLWSVLAYYQEFLQQRSDDAEAQAVLLDTKQRVERILADLAALRAASQLYLLGQTAVCDDLRLDDRQKPKVKQFCARVGKEWRESLGEIGRLTPAERGRRAVDRARIYEAEVQQLLTETQRHRLRQLALQAEGPSAFGEPEVVSALNLMPGQRERIRTIQEETLVAWMHGPRPDRSASERLLAILTEEQFRRWKELTGEPAKFAIVPFGMPEVKSPQ